MITPKIIQTKYLTEYYFMRDIHRFRTLECLTHCSEFYKVSYYKFLINYKFLNISIRRFKNWYHGTSPNSHHVTKSRIALFRSFYLFHIYFFFFQELSTRIHWESRKEKVLNSYEVGGCVCLIKNVIYLFSSLSWFVY